jgi:hypothetical protein
MSSKTTTTRSRTAVTMRRDVASGVEPEGGADEAGAGA